jgi:hypothetical protein
MGFVDPSKDLNEVVPAMQPLSAPIWLLETMYNYLVSKFENNIVNQ